MKLLNLFLPVFSTLSIAAIAFDQALADAGPAEPITVARWDFGTEELSPLSPHGDVHRDQPGPRAPEFPQFGENNTAVKLDGRGARFVFADPGPNSPFDFTNGDAITLEAWVKVASLGDGENVYLIGKGRTGKVAGAKDNQNWALRLSKRAGKTRVSFLFATDRTSDHTTDGHWHRWMSNGGLDGTSQWHHVAVSYHFGNPESIRGWIDGELQQGNWDMGGPTTAAPVVDDDEIWIGSSMNGNAGVSFRGSLDAVAIHRGLLDETTMKQRFQRAEPLPEVPPLLAVTPGRVNFYFTEKMPSHRQWPAVYEVPKTHATHFSLPTWKADHFLLPRLPYPYDDWGIRESWRGPVMVQGITDVLLPAGRTRWMVRARGLSRLWIDDQVIARTSPLGGSTDGHQPVDPLPEPPGPGMRIVAYGVQESFGELNLEKPRQVRVIFETLVGSETARAEPGETMVGIQRPDTEMFELVTPADADPSPNPIIDQVITEELARADQSIKKFDDATRRSKASTESAFWNRRHDIARQWATSNPGSPVPDDASLGDQPIDRFVQQKIASARSNTSSTTETSREFQRQVLPILRTHCFRCHGEADEEGGLNLTSREGMLAGGESGVHAVVPGESHASALLMRIRAEDEGERMPPSGKLSDEQIDVLTKWISAGAAWSQSIDPQSLQAPPVIDDFAFARRVYLDTVGVPPTESELRKFIADRDSKKRSKLIDRLLDDPRWADHWVSYWQDILAENPNMLKPALNNTGPFRWYLYEAIRDNRPLDRMATDMIMLRGSEREGGTAGFGMATDNDAPLASRGIVLASAFQGTQLQCARCHDSPYHSTKQQDLFSIAAMMARSNVTVPATSTVSPGFFEKNSGRESLIKVTLTPGEPVIPQWPFAGFLNDDLSIDELVHNPDDSRERLAASVTSPANTRFAPVMVNRLWKRFIGTGIVEPADDWETGVASHPELLAWLANELITSGYDAKHIARVIMNSNLYQREANGQNREAGAEYRFFAAPDRRRLTAEQVVDSMVAASGKPLKVDELTFDPEAKRPAKTMINLGFPTRAWMFATLSNERDRPSLAFPRAIAVVDVLEAFGWTGSRQSVITERDIEPNVLQPGAIGNGVFASWITSASIDSELAELAVNETDAQSLVESIYLRFLSRMPTDEERSVCADEVLREGFEDRLVSPGEIIPVPERPMLGRVSWSNHLDEEANRIKLEMEQRAREGDASDPRLRADWRTRFEDVVWAVVNSPEFVWIP
jgi:mono/diheme cytochrome c family protein